jgi:hypothetical protein
VIHPQADSRDIGLTLVRLHNRLRATLVRKKGAPVLRPDGRFGGASARGLDEHLVAVIAPDAVLNSPTVLALARDAALANDLSHV